MRNLWTLFMLVACSVVLLTALISCGDDEDETEGDCVGSFEATFNDSDFVAAEGQTCATIQHNGDDYLSIDTSDGNGNDFVVFFQGVIEEGEYEVVNYGYFGLTSHFDGESWWAETGTITLDSYDGATAVGTFDVWGRNASSSLEFTATGSFDVVIEEYQQ